MNVRCSSFKVRRRLPVSIASNTERGRKALRIRCLDLQQLLLVQAGGLHAEELFGLGENRVNSERIPHAEWRATPLLPLSYSGQVSALGMAGLSRFAFGQDLFSVLIEGPGLWHRINRLFELRVVL
jgi:hypothetical protein